MEEGFEEEDSEDLCDEKDDMRFLTSSDSTKQNQATQALLLLFPCPGPAEQLSVWGRCVCLNSFSWGFRPLRGFLQLWSIDDVGL